MIRKKGETIDFIDLKRTEAQLKDDPLCFYDVYRERTKSGTYLSEEQLKAFFRKAEEKCAQKN